MNDEYEPKEPDCPEDFFRMNFPSLKGKEKLIMDGNPADPFEIDVYGERDIQEHCLDKQKVIKVIDNVCLAHKPEFQDQRLRNISEGLKMKLGLEK